MWTHLISNVQYARGGTGTIAIATAREGTTALARAIADVPAFSSKVARRTVEPLFTTEAKGSGQGLGQV